MTSLIVDFPHQCAGYCDGDDDATLAVRFSPMSQVLLVHRHASSDAPNLYYSKEEIEAMKKEHKRSILETRKRLRDSVELAAENDMRKVDCFGIENRLNPQLIKQTVECRKQCWSAVLIEQARQEMSNEHDPYRIACIANHYTKWFAARAYNVGLSQSSYDS